MAKSSASRYRSETLRICQILFDDTLDKASVSGSLVLSRGSNERLRNALIERADQRGMKVEFSRNGTVMTAGAFLLPFDFILLFYYNSLTYSLNESAS